MDSVGRVAPGVTLATLPHSREVLRRHGRNSKCRHAGLGRRIHHVIAILGEFRRIEMAVGIDQRGRSETAQGDFRLPAADNVGEHPARSAGHCPTERAVAGVEIQVRQPRRPMKGTFDREGNPHGRAQAAPEFGFSRRRSSGTTGECVPSSAWQRTSLSAVL